MELLTPHIGTIFWTAVTFVAVLLILYKYGWNPILSLLEEREQRIKESLETAAKLQDQAKRAEEERHQIIESATKAAFDLLIEGRLQAEKQSQEILQKAQQEAAALLDRARAEIERSRDEAIQDLQRMAVELSLAATEKLIGKSLSVEEHQALIQEALQRMERLN